MNKRKNFKTDFMKRKNENAVRNKMVVVRMNNNEFELADSLRKKTTERSISSYVRKMCLQKPVTVKYRNQSADDFLKDMLLLKKELSAVGNNFNQAVHKLHLLDKIPEFRSWIIQYDALQKSLVIKVEEIKLRMNQLYDRWCKSKDTKKY
ncbi:MAG: hypothetical protein ABI691_07990 [Ginsengibacter sp.]